MCLAVKADPSALKRLYMELADTLYFSVGSTDYQDWRMRIQELHEFIKENHIEVTED